MLSGAFGRSLRVNYTAGFSDSGLNFYWLLVFPFVDKAILLSLTCLSKRQKPVARVCVSPFPGQFACPPSVLRSETLWQQLCLHGEPSVQRRFRSDFALFGIVAAVLGCLAAATLRFQFVSVCNSVC